MQWKFSLALASDVPLKEIKKQNKAKKNNGLMKKLMNKLKNSSELFGWLYKFIPLHWTVSIRITAFEIIPSDAEHQIPCLCLL